MLPSLFSRCLKLNPVPLLLHNQILFSSSSPSPVQTLKPQLVPQNFDENTILSTLSCYSNDWKRALDFFNWVESDCKFNHTTDTYNRMIDILGKYFEFDISWDLIHRMRENPSSIPSHTTFRVMFKRYVTAHLVNEAVDTFNKLSEYDLKDETSYCNLVDSLCEYKHVVEAQEVIFGENRKVRFDGFIGEVNCNSTKIHNMILRGWFKMGWWGKCREFWEEMDKRGVVKDLHSYSIYMDVMCKSGKPWKAVKLYKEMKKKGMQMDVVAYNTVIRAIGQSEGVDFALRVYREMREEGCKPSVVTCNTIMKLLCDNGRMKEAYQALCQMPKKDCMPDVVTYHCFFRTLEKPREILRLFDRMIESGIMPRMDTYVMLMRKFGRWGFLRPVFVVWKKMEELGCSPDEFAYNALIDALIQKGMLDMARKYDDEMYAKGLSAKPREELHAKLE